MQMLEVGKPFPSNNPAGRGDYVTAVVVGESFDVYCWAAGLKSAEVQAWRRGLLRYGAFIREDIPFFLLYFPDIKWPLDVSLNILAEKEHGRPYRDYLGSAANMVNLFLIDDATGILRGMRMIGLDNAVAGDIRYACIRQLERYRTTKELLTRMNAVVATTTTPEMIAAVEMRELGRDKK